MDANVCGWIAAYLEWADAEDCATAALESTAAETPDTDACSCAETAAAYLDWMTAAAFGRRAGDRAPRAVDAEALHYFREAMLRKALQSEADLLENVAGDVRALAARVLTLELH
jgi:hypothetical protein